VWALIGLLTITAVWGSTFPMLKGVVERLPPADFLAVRFAIALVVVAALRPTAVLRLTRAEWLVGLGLGVAYGLAQVSQTVGLQSTPASVSGFVTGMYVVFTPILGAFIFRKRISGWVWGAVGVSTAGLAVLSLHGFSVSGGVWLTLLGAFLYGVQIIGLGSWSTSSNAWGLTVVQLISVTIVCGIGAAPGGIQVPTRSGDWVVLAYMAVVAGAGAMLVQTTAQAYIAPTKAAVTMTMEPVWAGVFAVAIGGEVLGWRIVVGGAFVLVAMFLVELRPHPETDADDDDAVDGAEDTPRFAEPALASR
jgi:drug/metabolite transporter (DMT)-like permease